MSTPQDSKYRHPQIYHYYFYNDSSKSILCRRASGQRTDNSYDVTCLDCISLMRERRIPLQWDTFHLIDKARSLQHAAEYLYNRPEAQSPQKDLLPFTASFQAAPLLLAFATELALKAFICSERPGAPPKIHDLYHLYEALQSDTQTCLNTRFQILHPDSPHLLFAPDPDGKPVRAILYSHRNMFNEWRYPKYKISADDLPLTADFTSVNSLLTFLIETFHQSWPSRKSSFDFPPE